MEEDQKKSTELACGRQYSVSGCSSRKPSSNDSIPPPPPIRMARWPEMPVKLERSIGAECVRTIRREREVPYLGFSAGTFVGGGVENVKSE